MKKKNISQPFERGVWDSKLVTGDKLPYSIHKGRIRVHEGGWEMTLKQLFQIAALAASSQEVDREKKRAQAKTRYAAKRDGLQQLKMIATARAIHQVASSLKPETL